MEAVGHAGPLQSTETSRQSRGATEHFEEGMICRVLV